MVRNFFNSIIKFLKSQYCTFQRKRQELFHAISAWRSFKRGNALGLPGTDFYLLGRKIGWRLWRKGEPLGYRLLLNPVNCTRYFEFDFASQAMPKEWTKGLDVSSPFLFSASLWAQNAHSHLSIINPDPNEASTLCTIMKVLPSQIPVCMRSVGVEFLDDHKEKYDVIWSLSVIEHIEGEHGDDRNAVKRMYAALNPGGRLILTVPTDKKYWREYRDCDHYGTQPCETDGSGSKRYFFQRFYDANAIQERIVDSIGVNPHLVQWYGEKDNGHFHKYIARWMKEGKMATLKDPHEFAINYNLFESWDKMPGTGVCGLVFDKPGKHE